MFLESITVIHVGLSMSEIGVHVIIIRKNLNKKYYASQNKKDPK